MTEQFPAFAKAINQRVAELSQHEMFVVDGIDLYASYLAAFPEGTNPIFRTNTEHDCSCCKGFIRNMGGVVAIADGEKQSIWTCDGLPEPYATVAQAMDALVQQLPIKGVFRTKERGFGAAHTYDQAEHRWYHLHGAVARRHQSSRPDEDRGTRGTTAQVLRRGLDELRPEALDTVLGLIDANALYRGAEHERAVREFASLQRAYRGAARPELQVWASLDSPAARFRNTVIGTLVQDLSEGVDLERAVRAFETKVAPTNYKRTTALVTPRMVDQALATLADLGLEQAVERRFARIDDVAVTDVLFVDNAVRDQMKGGLRAALLDAAAQRPAEARGATPITMDAFLRDVVPQSRSIEVLFKNRMQGNLVSLTAPVHPDAGRLFKWSNNFGWSYQGEVTDTIKQRVKRAGGNTGAALRVSLAWSNFDDLDLHANCPDGHIYYGSKGGILDVDMNAGHGTTREPVENLSWSRPKDGDYTIFVHQFAKRETSAVGFTLQVECSGEIQQFSHSAGLPSEKRVQCIALRMTKGVMSELRLLSPGLTGGNLSTTVWGVKTETFVPVATLMTSPNHWDGAGGIGNKHWFFMLKDCRNPDPARGIYNEFLRGDLEPHRKVFEVVGQKTRCAPTEDQVSGLGFSSTRADEVTVRSTTATSSRAYHITF